MLSHFQKIKKIGCYDEYKFDAKELKCFNSVNIIYGNNGSGKTTLSNLFFLASKHCKGKEYLLRELFDESSELEIVLKSGKITHKNILDINLDLYVFNSKFIADHVYNGTTANIDSFSSDVRLVSPEILIIDEILDKGRKRLGKLEGWKNLIEFKLDSIFKIFNEEFQKKVSGARLTGVKPDIERQTTGDPIKLRSELDALYTEYANKSEQTNTVEKYNNLKLKLDLIININLDIDSLIKALSNKASLEAKGKVSERITELKTYIEKKNYQDSVGDLNDWFKKGGRLLHFSKSIDNHCPLCDSDLSISIDSILGEYGDYFSSSILNLYELLDSTTNVIDSFINDDRLGTNYVIMDDFTSIANSHGISITPFNFSADYSSSLFSSLTNLAEIVHRKKQYPEQELEVLEEEIGVIKSYISDISEFKANAIEKIDSEISALEQVSLDSIIKKIKAKITEFASVELNTVNNLIFLSKRTNADIAKRVKVLLTDIKSVILEHETLRNQEVSKLNAESKYINLYLKSFGIDHFSIDRDKERSQDNLVITYAKSGIIKNQLSHSLSEGEKTALAFAYFISKLRVEKIESGSNGFENCIIVIDDPISSLDDQRLFQTANLIDSFLFYNVKTEDESNVNSHHPCQLFILSHNLTFVKYFHNAVKGNFNLKDKLNEYYLSKHDPIIRKLPSSLKNFTNTYLIKLKEIIDFKEKKIDYEVAKNYLPNYIRIVLETFLSFKLAIVNDQNERLPGLSSLIAGMIREFDLIEDCTIDGIDKDGAIKRLNHLKKIADHESHGSIYRAEEFSFINEDELKVFSNNTLQVINFIDGLHFRKVKWHTA